MQVPDYYQILQVSPSSKELDIKKAYRKLVLLYHPDKTENKEHHQYFLTIQKAYQVLSNPTTRQQYHYKKFYKNYQETEIITQEKLLQEILQFNLFIKNIDIFRINYALLRLQLLRFISDLKMLQLSIDNQQILISELLSYIPIIPYKNSIELYTELLNIVSNEHAKSIIKTQIQKHKQMAWFNQFKILAAVGFAILFCLVMYYLVK